MERIGARTAASLSLLKPFSSGTGLARLFVLLLWGAEALMTPLAFCASHLSAQAAPTSS